jgi:hypothetical protein
MISLLRQETHGRKSLSSPWAWCSPRNRDSLPDRIPAWVAVSAKKPLSVTQPGMTREELAAALKDHVKGSAGLVTRFRHPT